MEKKMENEMETGIIGFIGCIIEPELHNPYCNASRAGETAAGPCTTLVWGPHTGYAVIEIYIYIHRCIFYICICIYIYRVCGKHMYIYV